MVGLQALQLRIQQRIHILALFHFPAGQFGGERHPIAKAFQGFSHKNFAFLIVIAVSSIKICNAAVYRTIHHSLSFRTIDGMALAGQNRQAHAPHS